MTQLPSSLTPSVTLGRPPIKGVSKHKRIAAIQADSNARIKSIELEIFHVWDALLLKQITPEAADHKVWLLRDDIKHIKDTTVFDIKRIREE